MLRVVFVVLFMVLSLRASTLVEENWGKGETFLTFLEKHKLPLSIYYNLDREEQELAAVFGIRSIPSLLFIPNEGQPQMAVGALPKDTLEKVISDVLKVEN